MMNWDKCDISLAILNEQNIIIKGLSSSNMSIYFQIAVFLLIKTGKLMDLNYQDTKWLNLVLYLLKKLGLL